MICVEKDGPIAQLAIQGPEPANALTEKLLGELTEAMTSLAGETGLRAIVLTGGPHGFMAGVDRGFFARNVEIQDLGRILKFTRDAHALLAKIEQSPTPVIAWVHGPAIGAGLELALACHRIVAAPSAKFAFPETGLGIYPGMGGTQRTPRRIGAGLTKWMIATGAILPAEHALEIGLIDAIHRGGDSALEVCECAENRRSDKAPRSTHFRSIEELFTRNRLVDLYDPAFPAPQEPHLVRALVQLRSKAPVALQCVEQIIDGGTNVPLAEGLEREFSHLREVFSTADARLGLTSLGTTRLNFQGK